MADYTKNYNLKKPFEDDYYNISDMNENSDKIDLAIKEVYSLIPPKIVVGSYTGDGEILRKIELPGDAAAITVTSPGFPDTVTASVLYQSYLLFNGGTATDEVSLEFTAEPTVQGIKNRFEAYTLTALAITDGGFLVGNDSIYDSFKESNYTYSCNGKTFSSGSSFFSSQLNTTGRKYCYIAIMKK